MNEVEVKVIEVDKEKTVDKLLGLGAEKTFEGSIQTISYDSQDNLLERNDSYIRLRKKADKVFLTYKKLITRKGAKIAEELETEVKDFDAVHNILLKLNLKHSESHKKKRTTYRIGNTIFEFDEYENIPVFMEIEAPSVEVIEDYIKKLGINENKVKSWTGRELMEHYGEKIEFGDV